ncbi:hypothetical protein [Lutibacter sp.]
MRKKEKKIDYKYILIFVITIIVGNAILSDWEHFKEGFMGAFN